MTVEPVSVCMATYNGEKYINEQIVSIIPQLSENDEIVVVDDNSKDNTINLLQKFANSDDRIRIIQNTHNVGVVSSFQRAILCAKNDIIFLCDQDDIWLPQKILTCLAHMNDPSVSCVVANAILLFEDKVSTRTFFKQPINLSSVLVNWYKNNFIGCCMCFRRSVLSTALPFPRGISMHDWWLGINSIFNGRVIFDKHPSLLYRRHSSNFSQLHRRSYSMIFKSRLFDLLALIILTYRFLIRTFSIRFRGGF